MGRLDDVCATLAQAVGDQIQSGIPSTLSNGGQVIIGWPLGPELVEILGQGAGQWQVSLYPLERANNTTRFRPRRSYTAPPPGKLSASVSRGDVTFVGRIALSGENVHVVINRRFDVHLRTAILQSLDQLAQAVADATNALALPGITATASGPTASIAGGFDVVCTVSSVGSSTREVGRIQRDIQMSIWGSDPDTVSAIEGLVLPNVGADTQPFYSLPDGARMWVRYGGDCWNDDSQSPYSLYVAHHLFWVEYGVMQTESAFEVGAVELQQSLNSNPPTTSFYGEP